MNPIVVATLRPSLTAHMLAPLPRCAKTIRALLKFGREFAQPRHKILVRQAMKSVAPNARIGKPARQGESLGEMRLAAMKGGIEARDLRNLRRDAHDRADRGEVVRLMERGQRR